MKLLTLNFLTCAIKTCKTNPASFPLHPRDAELEIVEADVNLPFLKNILPRLMWEELRGICKEISSNVHASREEEDVGSRGLGQWNGHY
jgi:multifunctional methyltransferase subunit TRM112